MFKSISLKFTECPEPLRFAGSGVTIFVGPNNSGKSLVLREIEQDFSSHQEIDKRILNDFEIAWSDEDNLDQDIEKLTKKSLPGSTADYVHIGRFSPSGQLESDSVSLKALREFMSEHREKRWVASQFLRFFLIRLDGRTRFHLTNNQPRGDLLGHAQNILMHLFQNDADRRKVRDVIFDAFGQYFTIDQLSENQLRIRLSSEEPDENEQNWNEAARQFHGKAVHIKEASDGIQAFVGIVCAVLSGDYRAILIDEPEAFLHPPLARKLGSQLTSNLRPGGTLMASTHSPDFLMGCLQASPHVRVIRLEYANGRSKGKIVDSAELTKLFKAPLLRSANVISSLFYDGVIVAESDNDRAFYYEIYHRLTEDTQRYPSILFVNAQNKQTIRDIIGPLRKFGIPAAAIVDVDILKEGGGNWIPWLNAAHIPKALHVGLGQQRSCLHKLFTERNIDMEQGGISCLELTDQDASNEFFDQLQRYGIFAVRNGELESWLSNLGIRSKKTQWTVEMLERLGSDPKDPAYIRPAAGDVWDFLRGVVEWVSDPQRKGTE